MGFCKNYMYHIELMFNCIVSLKYISISIYIYIYCVFSSNSAWHIISHCFSLWLRYCKLLYWYYVTSESYIILPSQFSVVAASNTSFMLHTMATGCKALVRPLRASLVGKLQGTIFAAHSSPQKAHACQYYRRISPRLADKWACKSKLPADSYFKLHSQNMD